MTTTPPEHVFGDLTTDDSVDLTHEKSIVDTFLNLDDFLAADIRLATKQAAWFTRPDLEAEIQQLNAEYDSLTDAQGRPLPVTDQAIGEGGRSAPVVYAEMIATQREYFLSRTVVLMQQLDEDDWTAFHAKWKDALAKEPPWPPDFYAELITRCAIKPRITLEQFAQMRKRIGRPVFDELWSSAWSVNTQSGVSIPKSRFSSPVQKPGMLG